MNAESTLMYHETTACIIEQQPIVNLKVRI